MSDGASNRADADAPQALMAMLVEVARFQGAQQARMEAQQVRMESQERRMADIEQQALQRIDELFRANEELRQTLTLVGNVMDELRRVCDRHGWEQASGLGMLEWLDHVLGLGTAAGWPSMN